MSPTGYSTFAQMWSSSLRIKAWHTVGIPNPHRFTFDLLLRELLSAWVPWEIGSGRCPARRPSRAGSS